MSSTEIYEQIKNYENVKTTISSFYSHFNNCIDVTSRALNLDSNEMIIGGRSILDKEITMKDINTELNYSISLLNEIIIECDSEIAQLWIAYYAALEAESRKR